MSGEWRAAHNRRWLDIYHERAALRDRYPAEFRRLRYYNTYSKSLRLLAEAHPDELGISVTGERPINNATGRLTCYLCGHPLTEHSLSGCRLVGLR